MSKQSELPYWLQYTPGDQLSTPVETKVSGEIPKWLTGTLYRNGSGMFKVGETTVDHLFDGMSVLHKFVINDGKVTFQAKLLDTDSLNESLKVNRLVTGQFGTVAAPDPCKSIFSRFFSYFSAGTLTDNTAVNIVPHGDMLVAMTEIPFVNTVDPDTLQKKKKFGFDKVIAVHVATAHPHSEDGYMYNLGTCFNPKQAYNIIKVPPPEKGEDNPLKNATLVASIPSRWKFNIGYNHSFGMSQNYFIILEQTLVVSVLKMATARMRNSSFESLMTNYPDEKVIIHLVSRSDGKETTTRYVADSFFCFHFINCYEEDDHLVVDLCGFDSGEVVKELYLSELKDGLMGKNPARVRRYVLPLNIKEEEGKNLVTLPYTSATAVRQADGSVFCTPEYFTEGSDRGGIELPRINYSYNTKKYRYAYGTGVFSVNNVLMKIDLESKSTLTWQADSRDQPGEPVFISRPGATEEDDGVILSPVFPMEPNQPSMLVVLDAKTFKELGRAVVSPDIKMPITFHGSFIPQ